MKRTLKIVFLTTLVISLFMTSLANAAEPTVTVDPAAPEIQGEVTFTATLDDENIVGVYMWVQECDAASGICYPDTEQNLTMEQTGGTYTATTDLIRTGVTYLQYTLNVETSEGWIMYLEKTKVNLTVDSNGSTNGGNGGGNGTPGFEIITLLAAVSIGVLLLRRKR